jgi:peptide/nickel transport system permease protein
MPIWTGEFNMINVLKRLIRQPQGLIGSILFCILAIAIVFGPFIAPYDPETFHYGSRLIGPSVDFWMGTDQFGRDIFSRLLWGARSTVPLSLLATLIATVIGCTIGVISGYIGGLLDEVVMRFVDAAMAIPSLLFSLMVVTVLGSNATNAVIAIGIAFAPGMARIARSVTLSVRTLDFVAAAVARGESGLWITTREITPNILAPVIVEGTIRVAFAIMLLATLSFLGLGAQPPAPEWGLMVSEARGFMFQSGWTIFWPGIAIALVAVTFNLLGDALRDVLNPKTH